MTYVNKNSTSKFLIFYFFLCMCTEEKYFTQLVPLAELSQLLLAVILFSTNIGTYRSFMTVQWLEDLAGPVTMHVMDTFIQGMPFTFPETYSMGEVCPDICWHMNCNKKAEPSTKFKACLLVTSCFVIESSVSPGINCRSSALKLSGLLFFWKNQFHYIN